jgi:hypothetical protein
VSVTWEIKTKYKLKTNICAKYTILKINEAEISALKRLLPSRMQTERKIALLMTVILICEGNASSL